MRCKLVAILFSACFVLLLSGCGTPGASRSGFEGLGDLPNGKFSSFAAAVSADGRVVVGQGSVADNRTEAWRWENGRMVSLGAPQSRNSSANGISADGATIVGSSFSLSGDSPSQVFVWHDGMVRILSGFPCGDVGCTASGISGDGSVVVGHSQWRAGEKEQAFLWTQEHGMRNLQDVLENEYGADLQDWALNSATHVSDDGTVIAGQGLWADTAYDAFRWMKNGADDVALSGMSAVDAMSPDGRVVAGNIGTRFKRSGALVLWTNREAAVLSDPDSGGLFIARGMSSCGAVVVGFGDFGNGEEAFIWTATDGMRRLKTVLEQEHRLDLTDWTLRRAEDISDDGTLIVGSGVNPDGHNEAWRAVLRDERASTTCPPYESTGSASSR